MIFLHLLLGLLLGKVFSHTLLFVFASILPDIDHVYLLTKHRLWSKEIIIDVLKHEEKYNIRFKSPLLHSLLGLLLCSALWYVITRDEKTTMYVGLAYFSHLLLDWPDIDKKQYLYPYKKEFKGLLPIWSKTEQIITIIFFILLIIIETN